MVDKSKIEEAVKLLLEGIGEDVDQGRAQGKRLCGSPGCMKKKIFGGMDEDPLSLCPEAVQAENAGNRPGKGYLYSTCQNII